MPPHSQRDSTRSPDGSNPVPIVVLPPVPPISASSLPLRKLSLPLILRTSLGSPNYLVALTIPDLVSVCPPLGYNQPPAVLVLLLSAPFATPLVRLFRLPQAVHTRYSFGSVSGMSWERISFPLVPCLLGRIPVVPSSLNGSPSTCFHPNLVAITYFRHLHRPQTRTSLLLLPSSSRPTFLLALQFLPDPSLNFPIYVPPVLRLESPGRSTASFDPSLLVLSVLLPLLSPLAGFLFALPTAPRPFDPRFIHISKPELDPPSHSFCPGVFGCCFRPDIFLSYLGILGIAFKRYTDTPTHPMTTILLLFRSF